jgi:hypothetical protein
MIAMKQFFWTNTENFLLLNVGHTTSPVRVPRRTETARGFWCMHKQTNSIYFFFFFIKTVYETQIKQTRILSKFLISLSKMHTPPNKKKIIKFTRISRTVWTFAKKKQISQNTENFHPCNTIYIKNVTNSPNK